MERPNPKVDFYFTKAKKWQEEILLLRETILTTGLKEELKWGVPCYSLDGSNVVLIHAFKEYCAVLFFKGALLKDPGHLLIQQTKNVQAARQMRFTNLSAVQKMKSALKAFVKKAIAAEKAGLKVTLKKTAAFEMPPEFQRKLENTPALKKAFKALTPGRQRGYLLHFASAKQSVTREARIETNVKRILAGKGLND